MARNSAPSAPVDPQEQYGRALATLEQLVQDTGPENRLNPQVLRGLGELAIPRESSKVSIDAEREEQLGLLLSAPETGFKTLDELREQGSPGLGLKLHEIKTPEQVESARMIIFANLAGGLLTGRVLPSGSKLFGDRIASLMEKGSKRMTMLERIRSKLSRKRQVVPDSSN
jgi:hypothetical protein